MITCRCPHPADAHDPHGCLKCSCRCRNEDAEVHEIYVSEKKRFESAYPGEWEHAMRMLVRAQARAARLKEW